MDDGLVCYCFGHSAADIAADARRHGRSVILENILAAKRAGGCRCAETSPRGV